MKRLIWTAAALCLALFPAEAALIGQARPAEQPSAPAGAPPIAMSPLQPDARETREQFREVLSRYPPDLARILRLDPALMRSPDYLSQYPGLTAFLSAHPEIAHNPSYYLDFVRYNYDYNEPPDPNRRGMAMWNDLMQAMSVMFVMTFVGLTLAWLVKTVLDHRRWLRVSRVQNEVHNKLLDRFAGTNDLLTYIQTPAGQKFLEASPIPLDAPRKGIAAPISRMLWSLQIGVVLAVAGLGFQFISRSVIQEAAEGMWVIGILGLAFGIGFILSAVISYVLSRRLGLFEPSMPLGSERGDSTPA